MTCISGIACIIGASIICIDVFARHLPGMQKFSIAESDTFLSASLSLSFGVMLFSALYSILPRSKEYLINGGYSPSSASYMLISLFLAGVVGIQVGSAFLHRYIPSHVVDCDHNHDEEEGIGREGMGEHHHGDIRHNQAMPAVRLHDTGDESSESTPLLSTPETPSSPLETVASVLPDGGAEQRSESSFVSAASSRRPLMIPRSLTRTISKLTAVGKTTCDETGPCKGYSEPCGQDCFRGLNRRGSILPGGGHAFSRYPTWHRFPFLQNGPTVREINENSRAVYSPMDKGCFPSTANSNAIGHAITPKSRCRSATHHYHRPANEHPVPAKLSRRSTAPSNSVGPEHHHHVPTNAFLSIGLQTSLAIALHKAPEGFITYATNHANPTLGFAVFMALFIHNITEGFAMALPLYLALGSRLKAMFWSSLLGGASQPIGAGVAAAWFKLASGDDGAGAPSEGVYGGMFAVTAGVMTSVALSLFSESLARSHNKTTCTTFAFLGMGMLGVSSALTAH